MAEAFVTYECGSCGEPVIVRFSHISISRAEDFVQGNDFSTYSFYAYHEVCGSSTELDFE